MIRREEILSSNLYSFYSVHKPSISQKFYLFYGTDMRWLQKELLSFPLMKQSRLIISSQQKFNNCRFSSCFRNFFWITATDQGDPAAFSYFLALEHGDLIW